MAVAVGRSRWASFVEDAAFAEREGAIEIALVQDADLLGVKAVEAADRGYVQHVDIVNDLVD